MQGPTRPSETAREVRNGSWPREGRLSGGYRLIKREEWKRKWRRTALTYDHIVVVQIRSGVGLRLGANVGYLKFTRQATWNPF